MTRVIRPIARTDFDEIMGRTSHKLYKDVGINFNHLTDTNIGKVVGVWTDDKDPNLIIGELDIRDEVYNQYGDQFTSCSVEIVWNPDKTVFIPTNVSVLTPEYEPRVQDTKKFSIRKYSQDVESEENVDRIKTFYKWDVDKKEDSMLTDILQKIYSRLDKLTTNEIDEGLSEGDNMDLEKLKSEYSEALETVKQEYSDALEQVKEDYGKKLDEFITSQDEKVDAIKKEYGEKLETFMSDYGEKLETANSTITEMSEKLEKAYGDMEKSAQAIEAVQKKFGLSNDADGDEGAGKKLKYPNGVQKYSW